MYTHDLVEIKQSSTSHFFTSLWLPKKLARIVSSFSWLDIFYWFLSDLHHEFFHNILSSL